MSDLDHIEDIYALSPTQQGMLFHTLYEPRSGVYHEQLAMLVEGALDTEAWQRAWRAVVARHPILRTSFQVEGMREPMQVVQRSVPLDVEVLDWSSAPAAEREDRVGRWLAEERARPFKLDQAPLMRLSVLSHGPALHTVVWQFHHLLLDGWSMAIVLKEVLASYHGYLRGKEPSFPAPRPYGDFITWLESRDQGAAEAYWRRALQGLAAPTALPIDKGAQPAAGPEAPGEARLELTEATTTALRALARQHRLTISTLVQGAWALLLSRYTGEEDVVFGTTVAGRPDDLDGFEGMVGLFINTVPMRVKVPRGEGLLPWLRALHAEGFELRQHEQTPLVQAQAWSQVPRGTPLFENILVFENYPVDSSLQGPGEGLQLRDVSFAERTNYPLTLTAGAGATLRLVATFDRARYDEADVRRMLGHLGALLEGIAAKPERAIGDVPMLAAPERHQVLEAWNATAQPLPDATAHALVEAQAARTPARVAVGFEGQELSYAELNARANRIAHHLRAQGAAPGQVVGLLVERGPDMVAGLLGVLKSGAAYLPLDPSHPAERLAYMLQDAGARLVLTHGPLAATLPAAEGRRALLLEDPALARAPAGDPPAAAKPSDLAYVIYTSGSTGKPKGTEIEHRALLNLLRHMGQELGVHEGDRWLAITTLAFDIAQAELLLPLLAGARVDVVPRAAVADPAQLARRLEEASIVQATPPLWRMLLDSGWQGQPFLRAITTGEAMPPDLPELLVPRVQRLWNLYGPTETTIWSTGTRVAAARGKVHIGKPIANTRCYVLDPAGQPCAVGVPGELFIAGVGVARGYRGRPELNAERFLPDPFAPGGRMYRTGDIARWLPDGTLECLGRTDHQVKIRGFRIELGEVEATLRGAPGLADACVVARADGGAEKRLVAYTVAQPGKAPKAAELRAYLQRTLPEYMVPGAFVALDALPLTPNGKVDRKALPAPDARAGAGRAFVAPRNPSEELVAQVWADLLGVERVGAHDSFLELGGHSLMATRAASRLREAFGVEVPLRTVFESPTVEALARAIEELRSRGAAPRAPPITRLASHEGVQPSFAQQRLWFLQQWEPQSSAYHIHAALPIQGALDPAALERALGEVVRRHEVLRTTYQAKDGNPVQVVQPYRALPMPVSDLSALPAAERGEEARRLAEAEAAQPFDLAKGPVLRVRLVRKSAEDHQLLVTFHHICFDGWSTDVFFREVNAAYDAYREGREPELPELQVQYADYAAWQRSWLQGEALEQQLAGWRQKLRSLAPLDLPTDRARPPVQGFRGARRTFALPRDLAQGLHALAREEGATPFMAVLAAFKALLRRYTNQEDIAVGSPIAGRSAPEVEHLIGLFVNTLVLRTDLGGDPSFRELIARVRETSLHAFAHQDAPFEKLVDELQPQRDLSRPPLVQVLFAYEAARPGAASPLPADTGPEPAPARVDFTLVAREAPDRGLAALLEYNTDLFDHSTVERMFGHFRTLLEGALADPDAPLSKLPILGGEERARVVEAWNRTHAPLPQERSVPAAIAARARAAPGSAAVQAGERRLTYGELDARANQLARWLRKQGVGKGSLVALCTDRSPLFVLGALGVMRAGAAYVPIDPAYPKERIAFMLQDTAAPVLLTVQALRAELPAHARTLALDADWGPAAAPEPSEPLPDAPGPEDVAYVIYTSGSTGQPKGVLVRHRNLMGLVGWHDRAFALTPQDRCTQVAGLGFDASVWEVWPPLAAGASLHMPDDETRLEPAKLLAWMAREGITSGFLPTPIAEKAVEEPMPKGLKLRALLTGGDKLHRAPPPGLPFVLHNNYGPTECTVVATSGPVEPGVPGAPHIGKPIANTQCYVLDAARNPQPMGVPGELYIGGEGVAKGYLNRPELTEERFVPNPFGAGKLYRTGDLARWLPDGNLEFLGRVDHQVKVRGYRIELGEIEAALVAHPGLREAAVVVREDKTGQKRLVAFVVAANGAAPEPPELRDHLKRTLPEYMVPSAFQALPALPLTPNGKVDRRALPEVAIERPARAIAPPRGPMEAALAEVWAQVLKVPEVGIHDNFFELGGDSILSIQVIARANQKGVRLSTRQLFQHPTIAELAPVATRGPAVEAEQGPVLGDAPLTPIQHWFFAQDQRDLNQTIWLESPSDLDRAALQAAVLDLLAHHDALRMRYRKGSHGWAQGHAPPGGEAPVRFVDLGGVAEAERRPLMAREAERIQQALDIEEGPLVWVAVFDPGPGRPKPTMLTIHHLVVDGVSWRVLTEDLEAAYAARRRGEAPHLPAKTMSFKAWAERLAAHAASGAMDAEKGYWLDPRWARAKPLPRDGPGGPNSVASARKVHAALDKEETRQLLQEVPKAYRTHINDVLLAALAQAAQPWSGQPRLLLHLEGHGREDLFEGADVSRTVGWFTSVFPVLVELPDPADAGACLRAAKEQLRAIPHKGVGYGILRHLGDDATRAALAALPQPQLSFNYLGQFDGSAGGSSGGAFKVARETMGKDSGTQGTRFWEVEINCAVAEGQLGIEMAYSSNLHRAATIEAFAERFLQALRALIAHCRAPQAGGFTPSDFPLARLDQAKLDKVLRKVRKG